jgi:hypothetical protein
LLILKSIAWAELPGFRLLIDPTCDTLTAELVPVEAEPVPVPLVVQYANAAAATARAATTLIAITRLRVRKDLIG